ncbi:MAG: hypothetical protein KatS3mg061_1475 [Dehalococcoidia bacterium]|nr:MAG: hypothetical protein KatS3mg061_1475 [Dehalococcoidia bacterium]
MTLLALGLVLLSAVLHASWNYFAKRASGDLIFLWLFCLVSAAVYAPLALAILVWLRPTLGPTELGFLAGSTLLHFAYYVALQHGYRVGDLSLVYPLARGSGPLLATVLAVVVLGERPSLLTLTGCATVVLAAVLLTGGPRLLGQLGNGRAVAFGLLTGGLIGLYTVWDKVIVGVLGIPPLLFTWLNDVGRTLLFTPTALRHWSRTGQTWRQFWREALAVGVLGPLSYLLVLWALVFSPVSTVAPAREVSIVIGAALGTRLLGEPAALRRLTAAGLMVLGVVALALG